MLRVSPLEGLIIGVGDGGRGGAGGTSTGAPHGPLQPSRDGGARDGGARYGGATERRPPQCGPPCRHFRFI